MDGDIEKAFAEEQRKLELKKVQYYVPLFNGENFRMIFSTVGPSVPQGAMKQPEGLPKKWKRDPSLTAPKAPKKPKGYSFKLDPLSNASISSPAALPPSLLSSLPPPPQPAAIATATITPTRKPPPTPVTPANDGQGSTEVKVSPSSAAPTLLTSPVATSPSEPRPAAGISEDLFSFLPILKDLHLQGFITQQVKTAVKQSLFSDPKDGDAKKKRQWIITALNLCQKDHDLDECGETLMILFKGGD